MLIALLLGAVLIGLLTGSGPYVDAKGMVGCSNVTYMLSKGISMMLILVIVTSVFCVAWDPSVRYFVSPHAWVLLQSVWS